MSEDGNDELLRRARELGKNAEQSGRDSPANHASAYDKLVNDSAIFRRLSSFSDSLKKHLGRIGSFLAWLIRLFAKWLRWVFIQPGEADGPNGPRAGRFSPVRAIRNLSISIAAVFLLHVALRAVYFYGTAFEETVYVTGKQEIITGELYQFGGCTSLPCSTESDNGKFYLIESSLYLPVMFYPEENVYANVPQQDAACHVEGYGLYFRSLRWVYKSLQLYQHVVNVSCRPYTDLEIRQAVSDGQIVSDE
ncbi:MAG: hypothetical protein WBN09_12570 [Woeseiaceae bacterium]